jgi:hypothetical protein
MESKQQRAEAKKSTEDLKAERQSDATDDEVLREEESRGSAASGGGGSDVTPSPDGSFDQKEERDKAGPM